MSKTHQNISANDGENHLIIQLGSLSFESGSKKKGVVPLQPIWRPSKYLEVISRGKWTRKQANIFYIQVGL